VLGVSFSRCETQVCGVNIGNHIFSGEKGDGAWHLHPSDSENINIETLECIWIGHIAN
jgi:hypothetical protein